jgi:prepilin-type N-terminal cleavage/methylation domain-containing protein
MTGSERQTTWCAGVHEQRLRVVGNRASALAQRNAFTLVEVLVVISIIGVLAALITPAVFNARLSARNAVIKSEIEMLHMSIMNYRNENGSYPPCVQLDTSVASGPAVKHLRRNFPRCRYPAKQFEIGDNTDVYQVIHPGNALGFWLCGYTGDPEEPLKPANSRKKLYDFNDLRFDRNTYVYEAPNAEDTAYLYFDSSRYFDANGMSAPTGGTFHVPGPMGQKNNDGSPTAPFFEPDGFIILSAGLDGIFYTPDDLSNAWKGTWEDYLDSQND